jgi:UPF0755 protein
MRLRSLFLLLVLLLAALAGYGWWWVTQKPLLLQQSPLEVHVAPGSSLRGVANRMAEAGVPVAPALFSWTGRLLGRAGDIKAGSYEIESGITLLGLLDQLTRGEVSRRSVTLVEGWTLRQILAELAAHPDLSHDAAGLNEAQIRERMGAPELSLEGLLLPDTYLFDKHSGELALLGRAYRAMRQELDRLWAGRDPDLPLRTPYEALILASIVEKETGTAGDRALVASVFLNRLRRGMLLQTDPTVIYGMGERFDGNLRKRDLQADTAWNTYRRTGLPPTPIAMPGMASLKAVLNPPRTDYLYFVARGDGSSEFSRSLEEHNRAVVRYQKRRRP